MLLCAVLFGACAAFTAYKAATNDAGLILNGIITLEPAEATVFFWVIAALGAGLVLLALLLTTRRITSPHVLEIGTDAMLLPHGLFQMHTSRIPYSDIQGISEVELYGQRFLRITAAGQRYTITSSLLPDADSYVAVRDSLRSLVQRRQGQEPGA
jgi:hypothetical protein